MKMKKKKKWLWIVGLVVVLAGAYLFIEASSAIKVDLAEVEQGTVRKLINEIGTVESDNSIIISSGFTGEIKGLIGGTGDLVRLGDLLLSGDESVAQLDLKSLKAQLSGLEASHSRAKDVVNKNKILYEQGAISNEEYNAAQTMEKELGAQVASLRYSIESFAKAGGGSGVTSPINGTITDVFVKEGEYVTIGSPLFEIADLDRLYIKSNLIAEDADLVQVGNEVLIYPHKNQSSDFVASKVRNIHLKAKEEVSGLGIVQKRVGVEIEMNPDISPRLGSDVDLSIIVLEKENVLRVPVNAVFKITGDSYVYVAEAGKAVLRQVEKGLEGDDYIEIVSGLSAGEAVIKSPGNDIEEGIKVSGD